MEFLPQIAQIYADLKPPKVVYWRKLVSCQNARVNSTKNRVMKNQKTLSCSFNLNRKNN